MQQQTRDTQKALSLIPQSGARLLQCSQHVRMCVRAHAHARTHTHTEHTDASSP